MEISWLVVGGSGWWYMVVNIFRLMVAGGGWSWMAVGGCGWCWMVVGGGMV